MKAIKISNVTEASTQYLRVRAQRSVMGRNMSPLPKYVQVLTPDTCECHLIWKKSPCRGHQVKMESLAWALIQHD